MIKIIIGAGLLCVVGYSLSEYSLNQKGKGAELDSTPLVTVVNVPSELDRDSERTAEIESGRIALLDSKTGTLTSIPDQSMEAFSANREKSNQPTINITNHQNGMVSASLGERFQIPLMATLDCNDGLATKHINNPETKTAGDCGEGK